MRLDLGFLLRFRCRRAALGFGLLGFRHLVSVWIVNGIDMWRQGVLMNRWPVYTHDAHPSSRIKPYRRGIRPKHIFIIS